MGFYAANSGNFLRTFLVNLSVTSLRGKISCPETSVRNNHNSLHNTAEECSSLFFYCFTVHFNSLNLNIPTNALLYTIKYYSKMFTLKHLKTLQPLSIIIQIIFRELVCSLLKSLISKFVKSVKSQCGDAVA